MMLSDDFWTQKYGKLRTEIKQLNDKYVEKMKAHKVGSTCLSPFNEYDCIRYASLY